MKNRKGYLQRRGKTWHAVWFIAGRRFAKTTGQTDKRNAEKRLSEIMAPFLVEDEVRTLESVKARIEGAKGELAAIDEQKHPPLTLAHAWDSFELNPNRPDSGNSTLKQYNAELRRFMKWLSKTHPAIICMRAVTAGHASKYAQALTSAGVSASTFNQHIGFLRLLWRVLKKEARTTENPWDEIRRKHLIVSSRRELTVDELRRVCSTAKGEMRALFAIGIYTGLRLGDAATLRWGEVDLKRGIIRRIPMKVARRKNNPVVIPIHASLRSMLAETPETDRKDYILSKTTELYQRDSSALCKRIQTHFENNAIRTVRDNGKGRAAVEVGFHSLRHTFVSMCREANAPLSVVESLVGHSNPTMTRLYSHTSEQAAVSAVNLLPAVMGEDIQAPAAAPRLVEATPIRAALESMTGKNWKTTRDELLKIC